MEEKVLEIVTEVLIEEGDPKEVKLDSRFKEDLDFDSMRFLLLITSIEDEFNLDLIDVELENIETVSDVIKRLEVPL
ncbi:phosphopantetheine-binding protein [Enterococcus sp.]|uniref:phosphopantetheine-binding protein n=1 Tax=Enterococcus sp. TaxID=35783 RepID=UPI002913F182|nr:phosphopantetheine-binding protein [Enterococcus sp.]MDU5337111.1 phosphopantetheine-binding protein [Enterococcus sp.]